MKKEIELKYRLASKADFDHFFQFLRPLSSGKVSVLKQDNSYFDTPTLRLKRNGISLRLRKENHEYFMCSKQSLADKSVPNNLSVRLEYEAKVGDDIAQLLRDQLLSPLDAFFHLPTSSPSELSTKNSLYRSMRISTNTGLQIIGSFTNTRTVLPIFIDNTSIMIEFDHSTYPTNIEIFEVEVEFASEKEVLRLRPTLEGLFRQAHIKTYRSSSKSSRLYRILFGKR
jgi:uncharacterized protein YjbK